jgi:hypothetical protein
MRNLLLILTLLVLPMAAISQGRQQADPVLSAMHTISSHDLLEYVKIQCDEKYAGRLTGTPEYNECAKWLASMFEGWGLEPAGDNGTWFQWFDIPYTLVYPDCGVSLHLASGKNGAVLKNYQYVSEYMPGSTSGNGEVTSEVVYAGFGITAPELGYDDYAGIDVKGKIILIEPEAPVSPNAGAEKSIPGLNTYIIRTSAQCRHPRRQRHALNYGPIGNPNNAYNKDFIYVHIGDVATEDIFAGTGKSHRETVAAIREKLKPVSFKTGKTVTIKMSTEHFPDGRGANIIGLLKGTDPVLSNEVIIIGAHLDHLGYCYEMIPGANDNASAVAVMMGVAKALTENNIKLKRSSSFPLLRFGRAGYSGGQSIPRQPGIPPREKHPSEYGWCGYRERYQRQCRPQLSGTMEICRGG